MFVFRLFSILTGFGVRVGLFCGCKLRSDISLLVFLVFFFKLLLIRLGRLVPIRIFFKSLFENVVFEEILRALIRMSASRGDMGGISSWVSSNFIALENMSAWIFCLPCM